MTEADPLRFPYDSFVTDNLCLHYTLFLKPRLTYAVKLHTILIEDAVRAKSIRNLSSDKGEETMMRTAEKIMELFKRHDRLKAGMVLTSTELSLSSTDWEPSDFANLDAAIRELRSEGHIIVTPTKGLELTEEGYNYLIGEG